MRKNPFRYAPFILKMVWREGRGAGRTFLTFFACIALGVGAVVGVGGTAERFSSLTVREAKNLLAADIGVRLNRPLSPQGEASLASLTDVAGLRVIHITELLGMASALPSADGQMPPSQLVEIKAVEAGYPFYGSLRLDPPVADPFSDSNAVWVQESLLLRLGLAVGDSIQLGEGTFVIRGVVQKEPDRAIGLFSLGPRLLLSREGLEKTALRQPGSRITERRLIRVAPPQSPEGVKVKLQTAWSDESVQIQTAQEAQPRLTRFLENFATYMGLVGVVILIIGGIGAAGGIHAFLSGRMQTLAVLKALGAPSGVIMATYFLLVLVMGAVAGILGATLGVGIDWLLHARIARYLPVPFSVAWHAVFRGIAMGLLTTGLVALAPLSLIRQVSVARILRQATDPPPLRYRLPFVLLMGAGWSGFFLWQAPDLWRQAALTAAGVGAAVILLLAAGGGMLSLLHRTLRPRSLILCYGIGNLNRPGRQNRAVVLSLGLGVLALLTLLQVKENLMAQLDVNRPENPPSLFFIDVQPDQKAPFESLMATRQQTAELTPLVRARLHAINGQPISERANGKATSDVDHNHDHDDFYFAREYVLTDRRDLPPHNVVLRGRWWEDDTKPLASVEEEVARRLGIDVGTEVTFDIQGMKVVARISSVREVDWGSMATNFYFILSPGLLREAPTTYVASVTTPAEMDGPLQNAVSAAFPNVTAIHLREVLATVTRILTEITRMVQWMALLVLLAGLIVHAASIVATLRQRTYEMTLLVTLGATRPLVLGVMAVEYAGLGLVSAIVGGALSVAVSYGIVRFLFDIPWHIAWETLLIGVPAAVLLTLLSGAAAGFRILGAKPMAVLREA
jgi:putative ABC transport system permease protein